MKASELRELTPEELQLRLDQSRKELVNLRMQQATSQIENPARLNTLRRDVARIRTIERERQRGAK
jgi:large subunit ribosomal protein L29